MKIFVNGKAAGSIAFSAGKWHASYYLDGKRKMYHTPIMEMAVQRICEASGAAEPWDIQVQEKGIAESVKQFCATYKDRAMEETELQEYSLEEDGGKLTPEEKAEGKRKAAAAADKFLAASRGKGEREQ